MPASPRLVFRRWGAGDLDLALSLWGDPHVTALIDARGALDRDAAEARLRQEMELELRHGIQYWPMFFVEGPELGELAGCAGLRPRDPERKIYELGFHIGARFWGRGLATEAAGAVVRFGFEQLGAAALFAGHHPKNADSARVLGKLGFQHTHDEHYAPTGLLHPSYLLRREEWGNVRM
jgi:RimJ/RimL family protein N-acetyltransferase